MERPRAKASPNASAAASTTAPSRTPPGAARGFGPWVWTHAPVAVSQRLPSSAASGGSGRSALADPGDSLLGDCTTWSTSGDGFAASARRRSEKGVGGSITLEVGTGANTAGGRASTGTSPRSCARSRTSPTRGSRRFRTVPDSCRETSLESRRMKTSTTEEGPKNHHTNSYYSSGVPRTSSCSCSFQLSGLDQDVSPVSAQK